MVAAVQNANRARTFEISKSEIAKLDGVLHHGKLLKRGSHGSDVKELQHLLNHHGANLKVDGDFGPKTESAVRGFQRSHGLESDGVVGAKTAAKLVAHKKPSIEDRFVKVGDQGTDVLAAEKRLKLLGYDPGTVDGKYDAQTAAAVRQFKLDSPELKDKIGQHMGAEAKQALAADVKQLNHDPYHARVKPSVEHRRLDALTTQQAATGISEGAQGNAVKNIQAHLKATGYDPGTVDGKFDGRTTAMVKKFQSETGLPATGTVDAETWGHLKQSYLYASGKANPSQTIGERSTAVKESEQALKKLGFKTGAVDGVFDAKTQQAVRAWERKNHRTVNGEISQAEFKKIQAQEKAASQNGAAAYKTAHSLLGKNAAWVKTHEPLGKYMPDGVPNNVNCASFVAACLEKNGLMHGHHEVGVKALADHLAADKDWKRISLKDAKPGDVVCLNTSSVGGGHYGHVVMFAGWKNGQPQFIGSNNANADGSQRITQGYMGYPIDAIYQYRG